MQQTSPATHDVAEFLATVQPQGIHYLAWDDGGLKHKVYHEPQEAIELAGASYIKNRNVWFALASFKRESKPVAGQTYTMSDRTQSNVDKLRSIWVDVDYKDYVSRNACLQAVVLFLKNSGMPSPSYMVSSGGGFHIYWAFDQDLDHGDWLPLAKGLRELMKAKGLVADYQCTVDSARILRMPGTNNVKDPLNPKPCTIQGGKGVQYPLGQIQEALKDYTVQLSTRELGGLQIDSNVISLFGGLGNVKDLGTRPPFHMAHVATGCGVVADSLAREGAGDAYPLWKNLLHLASFAEDGRDYIHRLSRQGNGYSSEETERRFEESVNASASDPAMGPTLCETFSGLSSKCATCPLRGSIKTPASIKVVVTAEGEASAATPDHLDPSFVDKGWTYRLERSDDEEGGSSFVRKIVADCELYDFRLGQDGTKPLLQWEYKNGIFAGTIQAKASEIGELATMRKLLTDQGMVFDQAHEKGIQRVLMAWIKKLQSTQTRKSMPAFGWIHDGDNLSGFAYNGRLYKADGTESLSGAVEPVLREIYAKRGTPDAWQELARVVEKDTRPAIHMMVATTFASPLMSLDSDANAFTMAFYSRGSGIGKSANLRFAQAVWAEPKKAMSSLDDTMASVSAKIGKTSSMPGYWDELARNRVPDFVQMMFQATQGKTRQRLDQSANLRETHEMTGFLVCNTNDPIMDDVLAYRDGTAGLFRFFQVMVPPRTESTGNFHPQFDSLVSRLEHNYGHAGEAYVKFLATNTALVKSTMEAVRTKIIERLGHNENERFWRQASVCLITGAILAKQAGVIDLNVGLIMKHFEELVSNGRLQCGAVDRQTEDVAAEILHDYQQNLLVTSEWKARGGASQRIDVYRAPQPGVPVRLQMVVGAGELAIPCVTIDDYCKRKQKSVSHVNSVLTQLGATKRKITLGGGTQYAETASRLYCLIIDWSNVLSQPEIDMWNRRLTGRIEDDIINS